LLTGTAQRAESDLEGDSRRNDPWLQVTTSTPACASPPLRMPWPSGRRRRRNAIAGTTLHTYLEENVAAADLELTAAEVAHFNAALRPTVEPRYGERQMVEFDR